MVDGEIMSFANDCIIVDDTLKNAEKWLSIEKSCLDFNKLSLNINKTTYIYFSWYKGSQPINMQYKCIFILQVQYQGVEIK